MWTNFSTWQIFLHGHLTRQSAIRSSGAGKVVFEKWFPIKRYMCSTSCQNWSSFIIKETSSAIISVQPLNNHNSHAVSSRLVKIDKSQKCNIWNQFGRKIANGFKKWSRWEKTRPKGQRQSWDIMGKSPTKQYFLCLQNCAINWAKFGYKMSIIDSPCFTFPHAFCLCVVLISIARCSNRTSLLSRIQSSPSSPIQSTYSFWTVKTVQNRSRQVKIVKGLWMGYQRVVRGL